MEVNAFDPRRFQSLERLAARVEDTPEPDDPRQTGEDAPGKQPNSTPALQISIPPQPELDRARALQAYQNTRDLMLGETNRPATEKDDRQECMPPAPSPPTKGNR